MLKNLFFNERKRALKIQNYGKKELELSTIMLLYCIIVLNF